MGIHITCKHSTDLPGMLDGLGAAAATWAVGGGVESMSSGRHRLNRRTPSLNRPLITCTHAHCV